MTPEPIPLERLQAIFRQFEGEREQLPPMFSAVKVRGKRLYQLARKGLSVPRPTRRIRIDALEVRSLQFPEVQFLLRCSKGTYVRSLVKEIGELLHCPATLSRLRRTHSGPFGIEEALPLQGLLAIQKSRLKECLRKDDATLLRPHPVT